MTGEKTMTEYRCEHGWVKPEIQCPQCAERKRLQTVAARFLAAVEGFNQSPFDKFQVRNYGRMKAEFMKAFNIKSVSEMLEDMP